MIICQKWGSTGVKWEDANWLWSECRLVEELEIRFRDGIDASRIYEDQLWKQEPEKRKRLIRLICKVKGEEYDKTKEDRDDIKITVDDIKLVVKAVAGVELKVKE